ncbi:MAG TPA: hypothetical protein VFV50_17905 [Bdellovibrionales bacterium]|nr:hypothetical protein [Bdellovibrionales bacterium]
MKQLIVLAALLLAVSGQAAIIEQESNNVTLLSVSTDAGDSNRGGCYNTLITILVTADAYRDAAGIGLYEGTSQRYSSFPESFREFSFYPKHALGQGRAVNLRDGRVAYAFTVSKRYFCWRGSMSSSTLYQQHVKPYVLYNGADGNTYRVWERANNYLLYMSNTDFDRSSRLLN